jgi:hypothetical protein
VAIEWVAAVGLVLDDRFDKVAAAPLPHLLNEAQHNVTR